MLCLKKPLPKGFEREGEEEEQEEKEEEEKEREEEEEKKKKKKKKDQGGKVRVCGFIIGEAHGHRIILGG